MTRYPLFDRTQLELKDLAERGHDLKAADCLPLAAPEKPYAHPEFPELIDRLLAARAAGRPVIAMMGAHPIKLGLSRFLVDLIERRVITHLATNGAGIIHDFELACFGGTSEDVARWICAGQFGLWRETSRLNDLVAAAAAAGEGIGEAIGRTIEEEGQKGSGVFFRQPVADMENRRRKKTPDPVRVSAPYRQLSLAAAAWRCEIPLTAHVGIGSDIVHAHPNCDGSAWGKASYTDFLIFARSIQDLEGGVFMNIGSAVTGPEVYLKALAMARNVARQQGREIRHFTTATFDLVELPPQWRAGPPSNEHPQYYYRPWKTILARTVANGGRSYYFCGDHRQTIPTLWHELVQHTAGGKTD